MAETIPDSLPAASTAGEKRVFNALAGLPDDCLIYYEPLIRRRYPDLVVILPKIGVLIVEVKGWRLPDLTRVDPHTVLVNRAGREISEPHPGRQSRGYMYRLMDECRRHPQAERLLQKDGTHTNRFAFPFCCLTLLSSINRAQLEAGPEELAAVFPRAGAVTRDELAEWEALEPEQIAARLKSYFQPWWPFPEMTSQQVDVFRSILHPEIVIRRSVTDLAVLDFRQERNARAIGERHRIVYGVAGSGKTVLLIARARFLSEENGKRVLLLCYNRLLASYLTAAVRGCRNIKVSTFHRWGVKNGVEFREGEDDGSFGERFLARLRDASSDCGRFDAVLIDEAQDWPCSWFQCAKRALREPETGDLLIVGDGSQSLYRTRNFTWKDAGIHAAGRTINKKFDLDRNYRNTAEILRAALPFARTQASRDVAANGGVLALPVSPVTAIRNGPEPVLVRLPDATDECHYAAALIGTFYLSDVQLLDPT